MMRKLYTFLLTLGLMTTQLTAQVLIGTSESEAHPHALMQIVGNGKGLLLHV